MPREELLADPAQAIILANSARRVGGVEDLLSLVQGAVEAARVTDPIVLCEALNLEGALLFERGMVQAAERSWCDLVEVATLGDQPQFVARASNNLGVTAILSMRLTDAITSFQRAVNGYLRLGYARGLAQSHTNLGIVFRELDHEQESIASFERALTWGDTAESPEEIARTEEELALYHLYICKDTSGAQQIAQRALERFTELAQPRGIAHASRVTGLVAFASHRNRVAEDLLICANNLARENNLELLQGEILMALSVVAQRRGSSPERVTFHEQARAIFAAVQAEPWGEQVARRMHQIALL